METDMPVTSVTTDPQALTMTMVAEFPAPVERLWAAFTDPRQLERFWGPPGWPATFTHHDFSVGGWARYYMTSPQGDRSGGRWEFLRIDPGVSFEVLDGFATDDGGANPDLPTMRVAFEFSALPGGSRLTNTTWFTSLKDLEQLTKMGMVEGATMAYNQLDIVLQGLREFAQGKGTQTEILSDQHVRFTRLFDAPREAVWKAYTAPELIQQWLLGPDGWTMPVCEVDLQVGGTYRYAWAPTPGTEGEEFGFDGSTLLVAAPYRWVVTEHMTGTEYPPTTNDLTLVEEDGATLLILLVEYPNAEVREMVLATGMVEGMEASFGRLDGIVGS
jgi:uncharacterized protein YndB with AHSA1/START domain